MENPIAWMISGYLHFRKPSHDLYPPESGKRLVWFNDLPRTSIISLIWSQCGKPNHKPHFFLGGYSFHFLWVTGDSLWSWRPYQFDILRGFARKLATPFHPLGSRGLSSLVHVQSNNVQYYKLPWPATWGGIPHFQTLKERVSIVMVVPHNGW